MVTFPQYIPKISCRSSVSLSPGRKCCAYANLRQWSAVMDADVSIVSNRTIVVMNVRIAFNDVFDVQHNLFDTR